ncbi:MAG: TonB-dependent receptor plug domain-containing protein [Saprospiraceae bacterium]
MNKTILTFTLYLFFTGFLSGQETDSTLEVMPLRETVVSANRTSQGRTAVAQLVHVLPQRVIAWANAQTTADLLSNSAGVFVQKSQQGGGSPILRGFEANRVLLVVDGVRMNNAIYRGGHLQNSITLDNAALERAEILYGPASTVYGSDALGGVICFFTKKPVLAGAGERLRTTGNAFMRYGTVNDEKTAHADISIGGGRLGSFTSFTFSDFGDLSMGASSSPSDSFGLRNYYTQRVAGKDTLLRNSDPLVQKFSGYRQYDFLEKILWRPNDNTTHTLNFQFSNSSNIPRYDRLTDTDPTTTLRNAEWYYGPQKRLLAAYTFTAEDAGLFDRFSAIANFQDIEESRHQRRFGRTELQYRTENVQVYGLVAVAEKNWTARNLRLGVDFQLNDVQSAAVAENVENGQLQPLDTRYPDGGSTQYQAALCATHDWHPGEGSWTISAGARAGTAGLRARFLDKSFFPFPFDETRQQHLVASGSLGVIWRPKSGWRIAINAASGFRVPNVDDLGKVFESQPGSVIVPNPDLAPEKTFNIDLNAVWEASGRFRWENVVWTTIMRDAIVTDKFRFQGLDSILYDGTLSRVFANQNKRRARLWGFQSSFAMDITARFAATATVAYTVGRIEETDGDGPLDHIPPLHGRIGLRWHEPIFQMEAFAVFNGKKPIADYLLNGEDNERYAPPDGMPAWLTVNLRAGYQFLRTLSINIGVDNLLDSKYRVFASGINAPGRNIWVTARVNW